VSFGGEIDFPTLARSDVDGAAGQADAKDYCCVGGEFPDKRCASDSAGDDVPLISCFCLLLRRADRQIGQEEQM